MRAGVVIGRPWSCVISSSGSAPRRCNRNPGRRRGRRVRRSRGTCARPNAVCPTPLPCLRRSIPLRRRKRAPPPTVPPCRPCGARRSRHRDDHVEASGLHAAADAELLSPSVAQLLVIDHAALALGDRRYRMVRYEFVSHTDMKSSAHLDSRPATGAGGRAPTHPPRMPRPARSRERAKTTPATPSVAQNTGAPESPAARRPRAPAPGGARRRRRRRSGRARRSFAHAHGQRGRLAVAQHQHARAGRCEAGRAPRPGHGEQHEVERVVAPDDRGPPHDPVRAAHRAPSRPRPRARP